MHFCKITICKYSTRLCKNFTPVKLLYANHCCNHSLNSNVSGEDLVKKLCKKKKKRKKKKHTSICLTQQRLPTSHITQFLHCNTHGRHFYYYFNSNHHLRMCQTNEDEVPKCQNCQLKQCDIQSQLLIYIKIQLSVCE